VRTRETAAKVMLALQAEVPLEFRSVLYLADPRTIMEQVRGAPDNVKTLLVIGHNPGMQLAALKLSAGDPAGRRDDIEDKFPTAALAVIEFDIDNWADAKGGDLVAFDSPKALV
jgi:phosphohistidine phosphatase